MYSTKIRRWHWLLASVAVLALVASACGDDDDTTDGSAAEDVDDANGEPTNGTGDEASGLEEAREIVEQYSQRPDDLPVSEPIDAEVPEDKTVYFITCGAEVCALEAPIVEDAASILGWDTRVLETDGSPEQINAAWQQVVDDQPDSVIYAATPRSQIGDLMDQAAANGTNIVACCSVDETDDVLRYVISTADQTAELGKIMAAWIAVDAADQGREDPGVLYVDLPDFPILSALKENFEQSMNRFCPGCATESLDIGLANIADAPNQIVSTIRANPDIKYVVFSTDAPFQGTASSLEAAGIEDVTLFGEGPDLATLQNIQSGAQAGSMAFAAYEMMFTLVDALARLEADVDLPDYGPPPNMILTEEDIEATDDLPVLVPDYKERFTEMWGK